MLKPLWMTLRLSAISLVLCSVLYPLLVTCLAQLFFPWQANGSLLYNDQQQVVGSYLIGQSFENAKYLQGRHSAAGNGYDALASSGSNLAVSSSKLQGRLHDDLQQQLSKEATTPPVPMQLVTASASGLDPHISLQAALWQAPRIAQARNIGLQTLTLLMQEEASPQTVLQPHALLHVLMFNRLLDKKFASKP